MRVAFALSLVLLMGSAAGAQEYLSCKLVAGWEQLGKAREYTADTLYE
jgi:hypothetical protein